MSGNRWYRKRTPVERLEVVQATKFEPVRLFKSDGEQRAFKVARELCGEVRQPNFYVMAQVSLGELFKSGPEKQPGWYEINDLRCDIAIFSTEGCLRLIIEVNGKGHYPANDDIKRHVYTSAGIEPLTLTGEEWPSIMREEIFGKLPGSESFQIPQPHAICPFLPAGGSPLALQALLLAAGHEPKVA